jgi:hypothetical protein
MEANIIKKDSNEIVKVKPDFSVAREVMPLDKLMEMSQMLSQSTIVPDTYRNRPENCFIALDMASRMGMSPIVIMQSLFVIQGRPSWSGQAIASMIRANPTLKNVNLEYVGERGTASWGAYVTAERVSDGRVLKGTTVTLGMAKAEGWLDKKGSKWLTMPEQMLAYRAYAFFGRVHVPELMMGLQTAEEVLDVQSIEDNSDLVEVVNPFEDEGGGI